MQPVVEIGKCLNRKRSGSLVFIEEFMAKKYTRIF
jgi:hypothetical protein